MCGGILKSVGDATNRMGIFMMADTFRELMVVPDGAHQIIVRKPSGMELSQASSNIKTMVSQLDVKTWRELLPTLSTMLDSAGGTMYTMFVIVYIAIGIVILNAMLMAVFERIREFGVLKALGMGPGRVLRLILLESAVQTGVALFVALCLSIPGNWYLVTRGIDLGPSDGMAVAGIAWNPTIYSLVDSGTYVAPIVTLLVIVFFAVLYPAIKAAVIKPVKAIYHQ